jgi:hypothetical protein
MCYKNSIVNQIIELDFHEFAYESVIFKIF